MTGEGEKVFLTAGTCVHKQPVQQDQERRVTGPELGSKKVKNKRDADSNAASEKEGGQKYR